MCRDILLVSEPKEGRIGIYRATATGSLEFVNWCKYPFVFRLVVTVLRTFL